MPYRVCLSLSTADIRTRWFLAVLCGKGAECAIRAVGLAKTSPRHCQMFPVALLLYRKRIFIYIHFTDKKTPVFLSVRKAKPRKAKRQAHHHRAELVAKTGHSRGSYSSVLHVFHP